MRRMSLAFLMVIMSFGASCADELSPVVPKMTGSPQSPPKVFVPLTSYAIVPNL